jgi:2-oxo-4-hydroxy-4-carboxy-5-ureidoimidazoline decarboxylase
MIESADRAGFVAKFGHLFEHSPWVVERAWEMRPFADADALHLAFLDVVNQATGDERLSLLCAHPELGVKQALTEASESEQQGAGLKALTAEEFTRFAKLNAAYRQKFGFPFIICVRLQTKASIFKAFEQRLLHEAAAERGIAISEIGEIARLRMLDLLAQEGAKP